ncbi:MULTISPECIES: Smr/MutS family protein [Ensifer]|jgi:DNA-nicking Smr family endonuclease|uniref:DNA mismatch repair protein MutS n=1 Tax=Ensifer canadensis TaxID=555315 RepID=A0AAW4FY92_9HYPH|nr:MULTISPECIES: Smr/MutS family protein [Ensifer]AHK42857.1 Smr protein/MutS2 domain protein [Ensifer adhaerens OV14]MDP9632849.1 DNA-nicking Smr family endonuclease [Ensifer adhaerens]KQW50096.1 DNA mismatch repair protein MutS [Ensifer sp. Root1252]KQW67613.1 DNA mismatch repair protein MutS [Ensifer sp. Root127]KQY62856.1 DNA mismatch repair protein MutS [Ensifer sp. Root142]
MARGKKLSAEERILWGKVARTTRPMPGRLDDLREFLGEDVPAEPKDEPQKTQATASPSGADDQQGIALSKTANGRHHYPLEKPVKRKLSKGHLALEARIDLHGMIQSEAHGFLLHFLLRAHERGLRHVLVITGKGTSIGSDGALKRAVPLWFSLPEFRPLISSYEPAARNHGGDGALYVRLARSKGSTT